MPQPVILKGARTPIGSLSGVLGEATAPQLGSAAIRAALERSHVQPADVSEVYMGCVLTAGVGQAPARQASIGAGIPNSVPCTTVNKVCGSGMKAVMFAVQSILLSDNTVVVAGGMYAGFELRRRRLGGGGRINPYRAYEKDKVVDDADLDYGAVGI